MTTFLQPLREFAANWRFHVQRKRKKIPLPGNSILRLRGSIDVIQQRPPAHQNYSINNNIGLSGLWRVLPIFVADTIRTCHHNQQQISDFFCGMWGFFIAFRFCSTPLAIGKIINHLRCLTETVDLFYLRDLAIINWRRKWVKYGSTGA